MNLTILPPEDFETRRASLAAEIARQRGELAQAYRNLEKPIHYAEYGMRGFGFLRQNPWIFMAVPAVFSVASSLFGFGKKKAPNPPLHQRQGIPGRVAGLKDHAVTAAGYAWKLYQLYRRLRPL